MKRLWNVIVRNVIARNGIVRDGIVTLIVLSFLALAFVTGTGGSIQFSPFNVTCGEDVLAGLTTFTVAILGIVTVFDLFQAFGWDAFVPSYIAKAKAKKTKAMVNDIIDTYYGEDFSRFSELLEVYFQRDLAFVKSHHQARAHYIMQTMGIKRSEMLDSLIVLRAMPLRSAEHAIERMKHILKEMPGITIKQDEDQSSRVYPEVQFYIDFISSMRDDEYGKELSKTFARYISLDMREQKIENITKVVIPADSNFLLGFKVAESLDCSPVIMREKKGRIFEDQPWDGKLLHGDRVIIVHDVLVSGKQVVAAMQKLRDYGVEVIAVYCIVNRLEYQGEDKIVQEDKDCQVRAMLELDDEAIKNEYYKDYELGKTALQKR